MSKISTKIKKMGDVSIGGDRQKPNDIIHTPPSVAKLMISLCDIKPNDLVLDCSYGDGVFYNNFPNDCIKDYCEITEPHNKDFFKYNKKCTWIISNPPYSLWTKWIEHTITICDKFCYIFGCFNFTTDRLKKIFNAGFIITKFHTLKIDWWFSPSFIVVFEKGNIKDSIITFSPERTLCEFCNNKFGRCKRGREGYNPNVCTNMDKL